MKSIIKNSLYIGLLMATFAYSCKKNATTPALPDTQLVININHHCDGILILFDTILYTNESGSKYSVTRLDYYISGIRLFENGIVKYHSNQISYVNGKEANTKIILTNLPIGNYTDINFLIGIATAQNISNSLENTAENVNM